MCAENCEWLLGIAGWVAMLLIFLALLLASVGTTLLAIWRRSRLDRLRQRQLAAFRKQGESPEQGPARATGLRDEADGPVPPGQESRKHDEPGRHGEC